MQNTLRNSIHLTGIGLHSGAAVDLFMHPAEPDTGVLFVRNDLPAGQNIIPALWDYVVDTKLCTVIGNDNGASVGTIEHLMAALRGCGIDNVVIEVNAPEVPIMDGSAAPFVTAIQQAGIEQQIAPRSYIKILKTITVQDGDKTVRLSPADECAFGGEIDFSHPLVGRQTYQTTLVNGNFAHLLADCRTFGFEKDVEVMRAHGLARGGSLENAIVIGDEKILNPDGLRYDDEFIRHKLLDAVGDLFLAGAPILGRYHGIKAGHDMNNKILHAMFTDRSAWTIVQDDRVVVTSTHPQRERVRA